MGWSKEEINLTVEEYQVCRISNGRTNLTPPFEEFPILNESKAMELLVILKECYENNQPAWYLKSKEPKKPVAVKVTSSEPRKTLRELLIEGYKSRGEEDLEIANEFIWVENEVDEYNDSKR
jgi:hypothetical protein